MDKRRLHTFCECPRFASGELCRHVWAVLLALAETGPENQPPGKDRLGLRKDRAASWEDLGVSPDRNEVLAIHTTEVAPRKFVSPQYVHQCRTHS